MKRLTVNSQIKKGFLVYLAIALLTGVFVMSFASCAKKIRVYHPPRLDLAKYGRIGMITFSDNAVPSVGDYATGLFQNEVHSAQAGIPIVGLGAEAEVLSQIGSGRLDPEAMMKIGKQYNVSAVFSGSIVYDDVETNVNVKELVQLNASVDTVLHATMSVSLVETEGGATLWSDSVSWQRKLGNLSVSQYSGLSIGADGYNDAYRKLVPDMARDVTGDLRGWYSTERVSD